MTAKIDGTNGLLQQYDYQASTTGFSYTFAAGTTVLVMNPAGTLATGTITMPASPADGMTISFSSTQIITALTVSPNTGQSIVGNPTTVIAGGAATFVYRLSNTTWYAQVNTAAASSTTGVNLITVGTSPGTWTKPATVKSIKVTVVGGGGSTPAGPPTPATSRGSGGGGGGAAIRLYPAPSLPGPQPYTVGGAGGTSSFGVAPATVISATGGTAGLNSGGPNSGSNGGIGSNGDMNMGGSGGGATVPSSVTGNGGNSIYGGGGAGVAGTPASANNGRNYGGGASGAAGTGAGGTGASGVVIIEEFY